MVPWLLYPALLGALVGPPVTAQTTADEEAIREARRASNAAIAQHDISGILATLEPEYRAAVSSGAFVDSRDDMGEDFAAHFARFPDAAYVRTTTTVAVSTAGPSAAESGEWVGRWTTPGGLHQTGGRYIAYWRKADGVWRIHAELFVPLFCEGAECP